MLYGLNPYKRPYSLAEIGKALGEAKQYIMDRFRDWNLSSETVYRLMMAVRRKFQ